MSKHETRSVSAYAGGDLLKIWRPAWELVAALVAATAGFLMLACQAPWATLSAVILWCLAAVRAYQTWTLWQARAPLEGIGPMFMTYEDLLERLKAATRRLEDVSTADHGKTALKAFLSTDTQRGHRPPKTTSAQSATQSTPQNNTQALLMTLSHQEGALFNAMQTGRDFKAMWFGLGYEWTPDKTQALYEVFQADARQLRIPSLIRPYLTDKPALPETAIGSALIHGVGALEEAPIERALSSLGGGTLIVGTTQAGKGVMLTNLVAQAIYRGEPVVVIDPKSSKRLRQAIRCACRAAGRRAPYEFHPAFPDEGVRIDPLGSWTRATEIAGRIAAVLPPESGAFGAFAWQAINVAVQGMIFVTEQPSLIALRRVLEQGIDALLCRALEKDFSQRAPKDWKTHVRDYQLGSDRYLDNAQAEYLQQLMRYWEDSIGRDDAAPAVSVIGPMIAVQRHNREHYQKITASLQPIMSMLTSGTLAQSISPNLLDDDDDRPVITLEQVIEGEDVLYIGLDALPDATVAGALGSILLADLTAYAGRRYNRGQSGVSVGRVALFVDETSNVINGPMIELLNKGLEAGIHVTAAMQTVADLAARLGNTDRARMALGNFNNLIALRTKDRLTQDYVCETFGKTAVWQTDASVVSSAPSGIVPDFRASVSRSIKSRQDDIVPPSTLGRLPNMEFFCSLSGGRLYKGRIPILTSVIPENGARAFARPHAVAQKAPL